MDASSAAAPPPTHSPGAPALKPFIKGERRYPCGYPGCKWIFTRSNHVLRHHQRVHPGYRSSQYGNKSGSGSNGNSATTTSPSTNSLSPPSATTTTVNSGNPPPLPTIKIPRSVISSSSSSAPSSSATPSPSVHKVQSSNSPSRSLLQGGSLSGAMINQRRPKVVDGVRAPMTSHKPIAVKPPPPSSPKEDTTSQQQQQTLLLAHLLTALQQQIASSSIGGGSTSAASLLSALEQQVLLTSLLSGSGGDVGGLLSSLTQPPTPSPQVQSGRRTAHPITQERVVSQGLHHHVVSSSIPRGGPVIVEDSEGEGEDIVNLSLKSPSNKRFKSASPRNPPVILEDSSTTAQFMEEHQASLAEEKEDFDDSMSPPLEPLEPEVVLEVDDSHVWDPEVQDSVTPSPSPFARVGQNSGNDVLPSGGGSRPYVCDFPGCRWSFKRQYHLDRHLLTHKTGGGESNGINVNNKRPFSDEEEEEDEVIGGGVEEGDSDVEVVPIKEERNKQPVQPVVQQQQQRKLSAAGAVAPPSSTVTSAPPNLTRTPTASSSSLSTPVMINAIHSSPSQGKQQLRPNQNQSSQLPATATVQGPIKGSFTCNYPGCGIKCQSQSSFEAHVYLTHIVMNARGRERERNRANAGVAKTPNGGNTASPGRAASAHRNNSLINSPFYLELQSKMKQKMMEQKQAKERMRVRQEELQRRYILQQQEERRQRLLSQQQLHQRQKNLMSSNLMLGEVGSSESESERVSSTVRDSHKGNGHHGGVGNQEVSTTVVNGGGRDDESSDQSATQQLSFLASILSAVSRQQNQKINSNNYPVQSPVPQRNGPRTSPTVEIPESLSQLERVLSGGGQKTKPMMKNQPSASNHNPSNSNVVKCPPGVRTSSESLSFLASLAQKNSQQQQQMSQPFTFLDNSATTLLEGNGNGSSGQHHGSEGTGGGKALFACDIEGCDKKFGRNCELTRHKLNHMDIWPFSCDHPGCGRRFKRKDVFKNHLRTHVKECPSSTSLMSHMSSSNSSPATSSLSSPVG